MLNRFALMAAACMAIPFDASAPVALADPPIDPVGDVGPPPDNGVVASAEPGIVTSPDGWVLTVARRPTRRSSPSPH